MVNTGFKMSFKKFRQVQKEHAPDYLGKEEDQHYLEKEPEYNSRDNSDKSVGATGRSLEDLK
ncbi:MAG TPA: hypothetical protein VEY51_13460 [Chondromyces sp.]|nr:hypothetical protein [Chondromyces sp.]